MSIKAIKQLEKGLLGVAKDFADMMKDIIKVEHYDTGEHMNSVKYGIDGRLVSKVYSDKRQAVVSEFGRKAGKNPPLDALVGWVIRKLGMRGDPKGKYQDQPFMTKRVIRSVVQKIGSRGIKAKHLYSVTAKVNQRKLLQSLKSNVG